MQKGFCYISGAITGPGAAYENWVGRRLVVYYYYLGLLTMVR